ncbi:unnamed protein product [Blepharisma stoltei]|uniref:C3H1-type domain-containing protein n=1 Tax=Blepharisma stoltei TaxID=1481888 RepID=A0AAU9IJA6_9CILI|nr:unnamed protein product [Blepharisma stoltei]
MNFYSENNTSSKALSSPQSEASTNCSISPVKAASGKKNKSAEKNFLLKFKTELCKNWESGMCEFGDRCVFAHGETELRDRNDSGKACKVKECKQYIEYGYCISGSQCPYVHKMLSQDTASSSPSGSNQSSRKNSEEGCKSKLPIFIELEGRPFSV